METLEEEQGRAGEEGPAANIGQVLERIVQSPDADARKMPVFPRESVSASDFRIPKPGESRQKAEPKPSAAEPKPVQPKQAPAPAPRPETQPQAAVAKPRAAAQQPAPAPQSAAVAQPAAARPVPSPAQARKPTATAQKAPVQKHKPQTKQKPVAKAQPSQQVRHKDAVKAVLLEKSDRTPAKGARAATDVDLETFMRDAEKTEEREIRCRTQTLELLNQIAARTGCDPEDVAAQAVACVSEAIQDARFTFCLPMQAELKPRKK